MPPPIKKLTIGQTMIYKTQQNKLKILNIDEDLATE
jgi:hypothetical protein